LNLWRDIAEHIASTVGRPFDGGRPQAVGGGCINSAYTLADGSQRYFVKTNSTQHADMFAAEAEGLLEIGKTRTIRVPEPICWGMTGDAAYIVLEHIEFGTHPERGSALLGLQLAQMHQVTAPRFGWHRDNTIGLTPQINAYSDDWVEFWRDRRLRFQIDLAERNDYGGPMIDKARELLEYVPALLAKHRVAPALLHGDLWGGNYAVDTQARPVIFDPAVYFGDRETELAMMELFGGFAPQVFQAYRSEYPLSSGYPVRRTLYNLYHVLNHVNLFGGGYAVQAERMTGQLLSEVR
jgi:fructosamine-3-kinase